ncbi:MULTISPECIES: tetratricopeptide repeat protein [unclassified Mesorhizobium]|uniref:tetratricopeptide repeat protein n=1 Tax=unclassified Mesorhizobium TaxID=325217 RepID=UPI000BAEAC18|nr:MULTISPECIES: tetratricopeptide repeat protein [unclassified Mesorhizobium]TGT57292.1 tetratricopeptide repeat protein [Mesorhizobium sp. M00.F.Ca.ET.170.01.1.1]AZO11953.1 tetratricopeptide repeat protein [Mesorhizobium sp. M3A.F.Ca.ET.080.04.2.1]PBB86151.1 tetratricopeptide repeat protein 38 family protein [Mesorhizobium sp. WSM3876]RWB66474.1 MAG: tetratricopeptide repeat protein [Mesorhizobium sp.]RWB90708.1 MAG: tetratricopeptide repeat protein [Mesorhizobium sp.]
MRQDWLGNTVTTSSDATVAGINDFVEGFLAYENKAASILKAVEEEPDSCLANAYAAMFYMFLESKDAPGLARPFIEKAQAAAAGASRREQMTTAIVRAWVDGDVAKTIKLSHQALEEFPRDLAIVKQAQYHHFNLGNCAGMLAVAEQVIDHNADIPYMHGLAAFGYEQCHLLKDAEASAWKAVEMKRKEPWAHHALAHVMITQGRINEGVEFLTDVSKTWVDLNSFMLTHNWWHLSLNYINLGRYQDALRLYDERIWGVWKEYSQDQIGAVSLLMRLELVGADVGNRWQELGTYLKPRVDDFVQPFLTMQYVYGLARAGLPEADQLMQNLRAFSAKTPALTREAWGDVCIVACEGLLAHARGDFETAFRKMTLAIPRILEIGGSHAQRALFHQILLDSTIKTGRYSQAQQMLEAERAYDPNSVPANTALVNVYQNLGLNREAAKAQARISTIN